MRTIRFLILGLIPFLSLSAQEIDSIIDIRDGQVYSIIKIDNYWWLKENLNIGIKISAPLIQSQNNIIEKFCYDNDDYLCDIYGGLYQLYELMGYNMLDTNNNGICMPDWKVPTDEEWKKLELYLGMNEHEVNDDGYRGTTEGFQLKSMTGWTSNGNGNNSSGFSALPGGNYQIEIDTFESLGDDGYWWTITDKLIHKLNWSRILTYKHT